MHIPKTIHYCWFGGNPLGAKELSCIESWRKFLPDYEIVCWDETNFDTSCCDYTKEAYAAKKWAFVSDYARFKILYEHGGLYFDTDVEVIKPLNDIVEHGAFMGIEKDFVEDTDTEDDGLKLAVAPGLGLAAPKGLDFYAAVIESYEKSHFVTAEGNLDQTTVVERITSLLYEKGLEDKTGIQEVAEISIYPTEYFCPLDFETGELNITENTRTIHLYNATWFDSSQKLELRLKRALIKLGVKQVRAKRISSIIATIVCLDLKRMKRKVYKMQNGRVK